jgi:hypothetical protein
VVKVAIPEAFNVALPSVVLPELKTTVPDGGTAASPCSVATRVNGLFSIAVLEEIVSIFFEP